PDRSAKLIPSRVHGSSSPAASPATSTFPRRSGESVVRHRVRCPESCSGSTFSRPSRRRKPARYARVCGPEPRAAITPTVSASPFGKTQAYEPGSFPQSSSTRPLQRRPTDGDTGNSTSSPRSTCRYVTPTYGAHTPDEPSAPTTTRALTVEPS